MITQIFLTDVQFSVCRPEIYRIKHVIYRSLLYWITRTDLGPRPSSSKVTDETKVLDAPQGVSGTDLSLEDFAELKCLVRLFSDLLRQEFAKKHSQFRHIIPVESEDGEPLSNTLPKSEGLRHTRSSDSTGIAKDKWKPTSKSTCAVCTLACDFCGADIFQSFFECQKCLKDKTTPVTRPGDGLLICPSCYVNRIL